MADLVDDRIRHWWFHDRLREVPKGSRVPGQIIRGLVGAANVSELVGARNVLAVRHELVESCAAGTRVSDRVRGIGNKCACGFPFIDAGLVCKNRLEFSGSVSSLPTSSLCPLPGISAELCFGTGSCPWHIHVFVLQRQTPFPKANCQICRTVTRFTWIRRSKHGASLRGHSAIMN